MKVVKHTQDGQCPEEGSFEEKVEKRFHKILGALEGMLLRGTVFALFLYGLWRVADAVFRLHP